MERRPSSRPKVTSHIKTANRTTANWRKRHNPTRISGSKKTSPCTANAVFKFIVKACQRLDQNLLPARREPVRDG
jgi:hypothetical protein